MVAPIAFILNWYRRVSRWLDKHALPAWVDDIASIVVQVVSDTWGWFFTAFYSIFYARHFYSRTGVKLSRRDRAESPDPYPYLLLPLRFLGAFLGLLIVFKFFHVPWLGLLPDWPDWEYDGLLVAVTLVLPLALVLAALAFVVMSFVMLATLKAAMVITGNRNRLKGVRVNFAFFSLIASRRFWRGYRYGELPVLLYCSINGIILWPLAYALLGRVSAGISGAMDSDFWWDQSHGPYGPLWQLIPTLLFSYSFLLITYPLVLRPVLYAFAFRSHLPLLRRGIFPEFLASDRPIDPKARPVFLDAYLEETSRDKAKFVWIQRRFGPRRVFNRLMAAPRVGARPPDDVAAHLHPR